jgi:hypothetical protein
VSIFAIDPGTTHSGWVLIRGDQIHGSGVSENHELLHDLVDWGGVPVAIEMVASYGMPVGAEVFETCVWIGRFLQVAGEHRVKRVYRKDVKLHLCGSPRAKDANIRAALIDRWGGKAAAIGTSKQPGPLYGVKSHAWAALAIAVTVADSTKIKEAA